MRIPLRENKSIDTLRITDDSILSPLRCARSFLFLLLRTIEQAVYVPWNKSYLLVLLVLFALFVPTPTSLPMLVLPFLAMFILAT